MSKVWAVVNNDYFLKDVSSDQKLLGPGVYDVRQSMQGLYLSKLSEKFEFDFKIYGMETKFITKVMTTWKNTTGNLGVIFNGLKGTGKTITAEIIANKTELPIILIGSNYPGLVAFLSEIHQDVVIFVDEYEKTFGDKNDIYDDNEDEEKVGGDHTLLGLMDGTYKTSHRKLFLLTTNHVWINENMINRPGRVRYMRKFHDLDLEQINEIIEDCLKDKKFSADVLAYLKKLKLITVDIVKAVISEVNIFNESPEDCCKDLNVKMKEVEYSIFKITQKGRSKPKEELIAGHVDQNTLGNLIVPGRARVGNYFEIEGEEFYLAEKPDFKNGIYVVNNTGHRGPSKENYKIRVKKESGIHRSFLI